MSILLVNDARSTLSSGITAGATALTVADGSSFPAPAGGDTFRATIQDPAGNREIIKCSARAGNTFSTIVRGQEGTAPLAFAAGSKVELRLTAGGLQEHVEDRAILVPEYADYDSTGIPTVTAASRSDQVFVPTVAGTLALPSAGVLKGQVFRFVNLATNPAFGVRINASGGAQVTYSPPAAVQAIPVEVVALQDAPTLATHWGVTRAPRGLLYASVVDVPASANGTFITYSMPADLLYLDKQALRIVSVGSCGGGAQSYTIGCDFGATNIASRGIASASQQWELFGDMYREGAALQRGGFVSTLGAAPASHQPAPTEALSGIVAIIMKITAYASGTWTFKSFTVELI